MMKTPAPVRAKKKKNCWIRSWMSLEKNVNAPSLFSKNSMECGTERSGAATFSLS